MGLLGLWEAHLRGGAQRGGGGERVLCMRASSWTTETGQYYMRARYYDPLYGRFLVRDPIRHAGGNNLYSYAGNNPINLVDPNGLAPTGDAPPVYGNYEKDRRTAQERTNQLLEERARAKARAEARARYLAAKYPDGGMDVSMVFVELFLAGKAINSTTALLRSRTVAAAGKAASTEHKILMGKQGKHIPGHPHYIEGRSTLTADPTKLATRAGSGTPVGKTPRGQPGFRERVDFGEVIGDYIVDDIATPTTRGIIHYSKDGIHIVPSKPI